MRKPGQKFRKRAAMDKPFPLQLDEVFFPVQEVRANPEHDPTGDRTGTRIKQVFNVQPIEGQVGLWGAELLIECDRDQSLNPPYFFNLQTFAMVRLDQQFDQATALSLVTTTCFSVLVGAARERLLELTSRAPWGRFMMGVVQLVNQTLPPSVTAASPDD